MGGRRLHGALALVVALAVLATAPAAGAAAPLPVGEAEGVRIIRERGALVVVFTPRATRLYRRIAGKRVSVLCTELPPDAQGPGLVSVSTGGVTLRAPERRRPLRTGDRTRGLDYCRVWLAARRVGGRRRPRQLIVSVPLTQAGAVYLDEQSKARALLTVLLSASLEAERRGLDGYPTPAQLLEAVEGGRASPVVALASPADTPPPERVGYYSDGRAHVALVVLSASGRRLFLEYQGDVLHTNVAAYVYGDLD